MASLNNFNITSPANNDLLIYSNGEWINSAISGFFGTLDGRYSTNGHNHNGVYAPVGASYLKAETYPAASLYTRAQLYTKTEIDAMIGGGGGGSGTITTASNVGSGTGIFKDVSGSTIRLRSLISSDSSLGFSIVGDTVDITFTGTRLESLGSQDVLTGRNSHGNGVVSYTSRAGFTGQPDGQTYGSGIAWGTGTTGSVELWGGWVAGNWGRLWVRGLRDTTDNWSAWYEVFTSRSSIPWSNLSGLPDRISQLVGGTVSDNVTFSGTTYHTGDSYFQDKLIVRNNSATDNTIILETTTAGAPLAYTFSSNTDKKYIRFSNTGSSTDPGFIMHETADAESNEGVLHLCPSDDASASDYVFIHGTDEDSGVKIDTNGGITARNKILDLASDSSDVYLNPANNVRVRSGNLVVEDGHIYGSNNVYAANSGSGNFIAQSGASLYLKEGGMVRFQPTGLDEVRLDGNSNGVVSVYNQTQGDYAIVRLKQIEIGTSKWGAAVVGHKMLDSEMNNNTTLASGLFNLNGVESPQIGLPAAWHHIINLKHSDENGFNSQIATTFGTSPSLLLRGSSSGTWGTWYKVWTESNDGSGSGLDADKVDGFQASQFLRSDAADTASASITFSASATNAISLQRASTTDYNGITWGTQGVYGSQYLLYQVNNAAANLALQSRLDDGTINSVFAHDRLNNIFNIYSRTDFSGYVRVGGTVSEGSGAALQINGFTRTSGSLYMHTGSDSIQLQMSGNRFRISKEESDGYIEVGVSDTSWGRIQTDRPSFYMNKPVYSSGGFYYHAKRSKLSNTDMEIGNDNNYYSGMDDQGQIYARNTGWANQGGELYILRNSYENVTGDYVQLHARGNGTINGALVMGREVFAVGRSNYGVPAGSSTKTPLNDTTWMSVTASTLSLNGNSAISYSDNYLRLNNSGEFTNGVYTPHNLRVDGNFQVGATPNLYATPSEVQVRGKLRVDTIEDYNNGTINVSNLLNLNGGGLLFESSKHTINYNDGTGNFNIKVGTAYGSSTCTENGYGSHWLFDQNAGIWSFRISDDAFTAGQTYSWKTPLYFTNSTVYTTTSDIDTLLVSGGNTLESNNTETRIKRPLYVDEIRCQGGTRLTIGAGELGGELLAEASSRFPGTGSEYLHIGGESGVVLWSSPDNMGSGAAGLLTAKLFDSSGFSTLNKLSINPNDSDEASIDLIGGNGRLARAYYRTSDHKFGFYMHSSNGNISTRLSWDGANDRWTASGEMWAPDMVATSDIRFKTDLQEVDNAVDKVKQLTGYTYVQTELEQRKAGIIAQDLQQVLPEGVIEDPDGKLGVSPHAVTALLVNAIKEQQAEIDELKALVKELIDNGNS